MPHFTFIFQMLPVVPDDASFNPDSDLKSSVIKKVCVLMGQFQKFYRDLESEQDGNSNTDAGPPLNQYGQETKPRPEMNNNVSTHALIVVGNYT